MPPENDIAMLYKLGENESLQSVANKFKIPSQSLAFKNADITFSEGVTIAIPKFQGEFYKVMVGDTIESICEKFNIEKGEFFQKNGVNFIYHGMIVSV